MDKEIFAGIMEGMQQAVECAKAMKEGKPLPEGVRVHFPKDADVASIRKKLGMTQKSFCATFGFAFDSVRNWETGRRVPDTSAQILLKVIAVNPNAVIEAIRM